MNALVLATMFLVALVGLNYWAQRSVLYPPFIFCSMFLLDLGLYTLNDVFHFIEINRLHGNTLAIISAGAAVFSMGGLVAGFAPLSLMRAHFHLFKQGKEKTEEEKEMRSNQLRKIMLALILCAVPLMLYQAVGLARSQGGTDNILLLAREALVDQRINGENSLANSIIGITSLYSLFTALLFATGKRDKLFWITAALSFVACILTTGRVAILILISGISTIYMIRNKRESIGNAIRFLRWPVLMFFALYVVLGFTNKRTDNLGDLAPSASPTGIATLLVLGYILYPTAAFDVVVQNPAGFRDPTTSHVFDFPLHVAGAMHIAQYKPFAISDTFVFVPFGTNVYTIYKFDYVELGLIGTLLYLFLIGLVHSFLYLKARQGGRLSIFLFGFSVFPLLLAIFADQYYLLSLYLRALSFGVLYFAIETAPIALFRANKRTALRSQT